MDVHLLEDIGLSKPQAETYKMLVRLGGSNAPAVGQEIGESRSNAYKLLDKLCELGLASKDQNSKRVRYYPASPAALEQLIQNQTKQINLRQRKLKAAMPDLMNFFFAHSEQPGVRFFQGQDGLMQIYQDQIKTSQPICYVRSRDDVRFFDLEKLHDIRNTFAKLGIERRTIIQDETPRSNIPENERTPVDVSDKAMRLSRTWTDPEDYTEPVEWAVYGNKLSIISYGQEAIGMVIESPQIARSFRRLFTLLEEGIRRRPGYSLRPLRTTYTGMPDKLRKT